jgi:hypothetical protein
VAGRLNECECKKKLFLGESVLQKNGQDFGIEFNGTHCLANESQSLGPMTLQESAKAIDCNLHRGCDGFEQDLVSGCSSTSVRPTLCSRSRVVTTNSKVEDNVVIQAAAWHPMFSSFLARHSCRHLIHNFHHAPTLSNRVLL